MCFFTNCNSSCSRSWVNGCNSGCVYSRSGCNSGCGNCSNGCNSGYVYSRSGCNSGCGNCLNGCSRCSNSCYNVRYVTQTISGATGPQGPQGPQGPVGPQGPAGTSYVANGVYANVGATTVAPATIIPLALNAQTPSTSIGVANGVLTLPAGTYLVSMFVNGSVESGDFITALQLNGALTNETITISDAGTTDTGSKTVLLNVADGTTLALYNLSTSTATLTGASLTAIKLA